MRLELADRDNNPESRLSDVVLIRADLDTFCAWVWVRPLRKLPTHPELFLFNAEPPYGNLAVNLAPLDWNLCCDRLAVVKLLPPTFELHLGRVSALSNKPSTILPENTSLNTLLESLTDTSVDHATLSAIVELAVSLKLPKEGSGALTEQFRNVFTPHLLCSDSHLALTKPPSAIEKLNVVQRASLWTPGTTEQEFLSFYTPLFGSDEALNLWNISRAAIQAVADGDFSTQINTAHALAGSPASESVLAGEAAYFKAEGLRLLAGIERSPARKEDLLSQAMEQYMTAREILKDDPRPIRGVGRLLELQGELDKALMKFQAAKGLCLTALSQVPATAQLDIVHEILRSTRHFIHCLLDIRTTNPVSVWHRTRKEQELEGYLLECDSLHFEYMPLFISNTGWYYIEWFMGLVFLAKAWGSLGRYPKMQRDLVAAMDARRRLMPPNREISDVERANLQWWHSVAQEQREHLERTFIIQIDKLDQAVALNQSGVIDAVIGDIIETFMPQWNVDHAISQTTKH